MKKWLEQPSGSCNGPDATVLRLLVNELGLSLGGLILAFDPAFSTFGAGLPERWLELPG